jgi:hypothetical protein
MTHAKTAFLLTASALVSSSLASACAGLLGADFDRPGTPPDDAGSDVSHRDDATPVDARVHTGDAIAPADVGASEDASSAACTTLAAADCAIAARCQADEISEFYGTMAVCLVRRGLACENDLNSAASKLACAAAEATESCALFLSNVGGPSVCYASRGTGAIGTACSVAQECASSFCATPPAGVCGTCQPAPVAGTSCSSLDNCGDQGLTCNRSTGICVALAGPGGTCSEAQPCESELSCVSADGGAGSCQLEGQSVGVTCDARHRTAPSCDGSFDLYCDDTTGSPTFGTCQPEALALPGAACDVIDGVNTLCTNASDCDTNAFRTDGGPSKVCVPRAVDGAPCNSVTGPACIGPSRCIGTTLDGGTVVGVCTVPRLTTCP